MRLLSITAGAADMYCGSCLRDNALAAELLRRGHDVVLMPVYTPTLTDEPNVSQSRVLFGGLSVYLEQNVPFFRHTPRLVDRLWDRPAVLRWAARRSIKTDPRWLGEMTVSMLEGRHGHQAKEFDKLVDWLRSVPPPDVVMLPNVLLSGFAAPIRQAVGRPVVCTMQGEDLFLEGLGASHRRAALGLVRQHAESVDVFVAVSEFYGRSMPEYLGIPADKVRVVPLGINTDGLAPAAHRPARPFTVGYMARVAPEKGLHLLAEAYKMMRESGAPAEARLEVAGYLSAEFRPYLAEVERKMDAWGLAGEFRYHGVVDRAQKVAFLQGLDVLSVPATYDEPKGLSLFEAMACGVPVVQPRRGAFPEIVERTGGGLLVAPDDPAALAAGLAALAADPARARDLGHRGREGVLAHYHVSVMADRALEVLGEVAGR